MTINAARAAGVRYSMAPIMADGRGR
jgi:hypothetical protein